MQKDIGRVVPLVIIPLFVSVHRKEDYNFKNIYKVLGLGLFLGMLICWYNIFVSIMSRVDYVKQASYFFQWIYTDFNLVKPLDGHPSYFAILLVLFISAILFNKEFYNIRKNKLKFVLFLSPFFLFLIETNSRIGVIVLVMMVLYHAIKQGSTKLFLSGVALVFLIVLLAIKFDYLGSKFKKIFSPEGSVSIERVERWKEIIQVFNDEDNFWFGVGSGDARLVYRRAYYNGGFELALKKNYNAHNQYLEFFVSNGIFGLAIYLFVFFNFFRNTYLRINAIHFFIAFLMFSMSESFLGRSQGVMIFSFFYSFLLLYYKPTHNLSNAKEE
ncbi:O-antigen ligase family protein [Yeosuana sp.]|uniref:O-antigen ligase family protein n=1 Tax=Yeosuana sp. TaxID=2529388 RepID=UPI004054D57D